ncbi:MAG: hypothetical protein GSR73_05045, partial [Desulfurococcales archaeon]|nr:hypothetical protein [Desulfurococcales archaeon]
AVLSGLLHDLGKASGFYQRNLERGFGFHEHVAGVVLSKAAEVGRLSGDIAGWRLLRLASYVITRHHVAMVNRHPDSIVNNRRASCVIERALKELNPDTLSQMGLDLFLPRGINDYIRESLSSLKRDNKLISRYLGHNTTRNIVEDEFCDAGGPGHSQGYRLLKTVQVLAGILIVSDILVAWKERGPKDPGRLYARSWLAELNVEKSLEEIASLNNPSQIYSKYLKYNTTRVVGP